VAIDRDALLARGDEELDEFVERAETNVRDLFPRRLSLAVFWPRRETGRFVGARATNGRPVARGVRRLGLVGAVVGADARHDDAAVECRDLAVVREERAVLGGGDEIDAD